MQALRAELQEAQAAVLGIATPTPTPNPQPNPNPNPKPNQAALLGMGAMRQEVAAV